MEIKKPTKKIKNIRDQLGDKYSIIPIDLEQVIYRKLNDKYDIEVSGLNNNKKTINSIIYIWNLSTMRIIEIINDINSIEKLSEILIQCEKKYNE